MEDVEHTNIKKLCNFYVSEIHLSVMLLPYINKEINEDVEVATMFEKIDKESFEKVLEKINVKDKEKILNLNWINNQNTEDKIENLFNDKNNNKKYTIIIGGNKNYISEENKKIFNFIEKNNFNKNNIKIINCYNVEEVAQEMNLIARNYDGILNTCGELKNAV